MEVSIESTHHVWTLDFTSGGKRAGIVVSQSQMRDIELLITPLGGLHTDLDDVSIFSFNVNSWVDILVMFYELLPGIQELISDSWILERQLNTNGTRHYM